MEFEELNRTTENAEPVPVSAGETAGEPTKTETVTVTERVTETANGTVTETVTETVTTTVTNTVTEVKTEAASEEPVAEEPVAEEPASEEAVPEETVAEEPAPAKILHLNFTKPTDVYTGTHVTLEELVGEFPYYNQVLSFFRDGTATVELRKRFMLKMIDEVWVRIIEDTIPSLDVITRRPGRLLEELEEVLPIEQTKKVTSRSIQHLSQHTDYINEIKKDGSVMPSKLLNVFQDETILTYENRFINTLINRLYAFVAIRFNAASECGEDEKNTSLTFHQEFEDGDRRGKITLSIEVSEPPSENEKVKNYIYSSDLWKRVVRLRKIVTEYMDCSFARELGRNFVRPPIMRTNKLLKNVDFHQCLLLWEFMESYENTGYESLIQESLETVSDEALADFYKSMVEQYVLFQKHIRNEFDTSATLDERLTDTVIHPEIKEELDPFTEREYDRRDLIPDKKPEGGITETGLEDDIERAIRIALAADDLLVAEEADENEEGVLEEGQVIYRYRHSFLSRLIRAQNPTQDYYTEIKNELLSYQKVKSRISWNHEAYSFGRKKVARINVKGKTVFLYLPLDPNDYIDSKYFIVDVSDSKRTADVPTLLRVRSERGVKYAKELIAVVMAKLGLEKFENPAVRDFHMAYATTVEMTLWDPPLVKIVDQKGRVINASDAGFNIGLPPDVAAMAISDEPDEDDNIPELSDEESAEESAAGGETGLAAVGGISDEPWFYRFRYSFLARLIQAPEPVQLYYTAIKNYFLSYKKVKSNIAWAHESYRYGRGAIAKIKIRGKAVILYLALNPADYVDTKYHVKDLTNEFGIAPPLPALFKVRSERAVKYACELIDALMASLEGVQGAIPAEDYRRPYATTLAMTEWEPPLVKIVDQKGRIVNPSDADFDPERLPASATMGGADEPDEDDIPGVTDNDDDDETGESAGEAAEFAAGNIPADATVPAVPGTITETETSYRYRFSFRARLIQAPEEVQLRYSTVKNYLLSYKKVKSNIAWGYETFRYGRGAVVKIKIRGKAIVLCLALDPAAYADSKYHVKDLTDESGAAPALPVLFKVKSARGVKYACELIDDLMLSLGAVQGEIPTEDYRQPYQTTIELLTMPFPLVRSTEVTRTVERPRNEDDPLPDDETDDASDDDTDAENADNAEENE